MQHLNINKLLRFNKFLNEAEENPKLNVLILSGAETISKTAKSFEEECKERGITCNVLNVDNSSMEKLYNGHIITDHESNSEIIINPETTIVIPRRGVVKNSKTKQLMRNLEKNRYFCVNSLSSIEACENKYLTSVLLEEEGLPVPKYAIISDENTLDPALEKIGGEFPVIMKLLSGSQGIGVSIIDSYASLKSVYQTLRKVSPENEILLQEKIDSNYDIRVQIIIKKFDPLNTKNNMDNCEILGSMKREAVEKDFRTNYSLGGEVKDFEMTDEIMELSCKAANAVGCHWCGVDIMIDEKTNKPYILEVNASPGTEGISKVINKPIVGSVLDYVTDKNNWAYSEMEVGYLETVKIPGIGNLVAKFDTGNGSTSCTIHADSVNVEGEMLVWSIGDKKMENKIVGYSSAEIGRDKEKRPVIEVSFSLGDAYIEKLRVSPTDRTQKSTPFLVNRKLMRDLGLTVNPYKAFVVSDKPKSGFSPKHSKGDKLAGIEFIDDSEE